MQGQEDSRDPVKLTKFTHLVDVLSSHLTYVFNKRKNLRYFKLNAFLEVRSINIRKISKLSR